MNINLTLMATPDGVAVSADDSLMAAGRNGITLPERSGEL